ncbi:class II fructose-1,6-bisphosphate aldolase [Brevibacillus choshinensis]|uniref:class II fructose-1,6-bisphosphate aldolase n=1 Tax=Brevibacillus choshinensis TaxID=54911 RepID=UPI002E1BB8C4|nr:class II fructose-1,6-bisphosphate aldolase [Brevibacillus choshinensis]MED4585899.1 class II fructose-1,6-bisphosphate aldolase [Brevibacillus choshinensis]
MGLVSSTPLLQEARKNGYGIVAFNVHTLEMMQAVVDAAEESRSPLILQSTVGTVKHLGMDYLVACARVAAEKATVPIALHLDHCQDFDLIVRCMRAGYTSVMIDASMHPFEENVQRTKKVVEVAKALGVNVEAELGKVGGVEDDIVVDEADALLADPLECVEFIERTGVPTLAPAIGTAHGIYKGEPNIDFHRIEEIYNRVGIPLVLHGGSGIPAEQVRRCVSLGMAKMNVATELKNAFSESIKQSFLNDPSELDPRKYMVPAKEAVKQLAKQKMELCGCFGRA